MSRTVWRLSVNTYKGLVYGAEHYMATLKPPDKRDNPNIFGGEYGWGPDPIPVEYVLDAETAKRLSTDDFTYREGWESNRFFSYEDAFAAAVARFQELAEPGETLVGYLDDDADEESTLSTKEVVS